MRILVCGTRDFCDYDLLTASLDSYLFFSNLEHEAWEIISGGCTGTDQLAEKYAKENHCLFTVFRPNWDLHGRAAGPIRNSQMIEYIKQSTERMVIAFWDLKSKGTLDTITKAIENDIPTIIIPYKEK